mmetsp:Transcript_6220/g.14162  ORF Transcript_6220/g.14162 Transcript_6220/m.14162 type:complete len:459 (+) Transcript_6220:27-1403(+)
MPLLDIVAGATSFQSLPAPDNCSTVAGFRAEIADGLILGGAKVKQAGERLEACAKRLTFLLEKDGLPLAEAAQLPTSPKKLYIDGATVAVRTLVQCLRKKLQVKSLSARGPPREQNSRAGPRTTLRTARGPQNARLQDEEASAAQDREAASHVINFWFEEVTTDDWFRQSHILDDRIRKDFAALHSRAAAGELADWTHQQDTCLALVVILDQFSRSLYRNTPAAFACDGAARVAANAALARGDDKNHWPPGPKRWALYLPFMHSEDLQDKQRCVNLMREGAKSSLFGKGGNSPVSGRGGTASKEGLPKLQTASISGSSSMTGDRKGKMASKSKRAPEEVSGSKSPGLEEAVEADEDSDYSDDMEELGTFKAAGGGRAAPRERKAYSMQAAADISALPVLPLNHAHAQRFREMRLDAQTEAYLRDRKDAPRVVRYQCLVCQTEHEFRMSKGAAGAEHQH